MLSVAQAHYYEHINSFMAVHTVIIIIALVIILIRISLVTLS